MKQITQSKELAKRMLHSLSIVLFIRCTLENYVMKEEHYMIAKTDTSNVEHKDAKDSQVQQNALIPLIAILTTIVIQILNNAFQLNNMEKIAIVMMNAAEMLYANSHQ